MCAARRAGLSCPADAVHSAPDSCILWLCACQPPTRTACGFRCVTIVMRHADGFKLWIGLASVLTAIVASTPYSTLIDNSNPYQAYIALCIAFDKRVLLLSLWAFPSSKMALCFAARDACSMTVQQCSTAR